MCVRLHLSTGCDLVLLGAIGVATVKPWYRHSTAINIHFPKYVYVYIFMFSGKLVFVYFVSAHAIDHTGEFEFYNFLKINIYLLHYLLFFFFTTLGAWISQGPPFIFKIWMLRCAL